jgi:hypothetical protein
MSLIDLISIVPYFIFLILREYIESNAGLFSLFRMLRLFRLIKVKSKIKKGGKTEFGNKSDF